MIVKLIKICMYIISILTRKNVFYNIRQINLSFKFFLSKTITSFTFYYKTHFNSLLKLCDIYKSMKISTCLVTF